MALPTSIEEFATASFWESFFEAREGKSFEWYCEYEQLAPFFVEPGLRSSSTRVLHAGCGNSNLSFELVEKANFDYVLNVDFSCLALVEMNGKAAQLPPNVRCRVDFQVLDCLCLPILNQQFSWVVDKGLHDAMMKDSGDECRARSATLFSEFARVLDASGQFLMVTLAQTHIVDLLEAAAAQHLWAGVRVVALSDVVSNLLPFVVVFSKGTACETPDLLFNGRQHPISALRALITSAQDAYTQAAAKKKAAARKDRHAYLVTLDIKPWEEVADFGPLQLAVRSAALPHVVWREAVEIVPIAYGLKKLRVQCVVDTAKRDTDSVADELGEILGEDDVQSIDIFSCVPLRA